MMWLQKAHIYKWYHRVGAIFLVLNCTFWHVWTSQIPLMSQPWKSTCCCSHMCLHLAGGVQKWDAYATVPAYCLQVAPGAKCCFCCHGRKHLKATNTSTVPSKESHLIRRGTRARAHVACVACVATGHAFSATDGKKVAGFDGDGAGLSARSGARSGASRLETGQRKPLMARWDRFSPWAKGIGKCSQLFTSWKSSHVERCQFSVGKYCPIVTSSESEATAHLKSLKSMPLGGVWTPKCSGLPEDGSQNSGASRSSTTNRFHGNQWALSGFALRCTDLFSGSLPLDAVASLGQMEKSWDWLGPSLFTLHPPGTPNRHSTLVPIQLKHPFINVKWFSEGTTHHAFFFGVPGDDSLLLCLCSHYPERFHLPKLTFQWSIQVLVDPFCQALPPQFIASGYLASNEPTSTSSWIQSNIKQWSHGHLPASSLIPANAWDIHSKTSHKPWKPQLSDWFSGNTMGKIYHP